MSVAAAARFLRQKTLSARLNLHKKRVRKAFHFESEARALSRTPLGAKANLVLISPVIIDFETVTTFSSANET